MTVTDVPGRFGEYGGRYVPEGLIAAFIEAVRQAESEEE